MKFKLIGLTTLVSIMLLGEREAIAQHATPPQYFVPTIAPRAPNTAALEKYGSYDVNMFTGVPNISIPLYTIESGDLKIPITLSYHASGIKVTEIASWVGLGWSISAGGTISRRIQGLADDGPYGYLSGNMKTAGTYPSNTDAGMDYLEGASNGLYDTRPDIYSYDFPGHSGKFFFNGSDGVNFRPTMIPYAPIKVGYLYDGVKLNTFNVTDEHGTKYRYGDGNVEISSTNAGGTHVVNSITGWQLKSMTSQNNRDTVAFTYVDNSVTYPIADSEIWTVLDQIYDPYQNQSYQASYSSTPTTPGTNSLTQEKLLQHIYFKNGRVDFTLDAATRTDIDGGSSGAQSLNNIKVYKYNFSAKNYELLKTIQFFKSYFINPNETFVNGQKRLRLDSLQIIDQAGTVIQHYRFDYNTSVMLPAYTSKKIDYWGYYNGKDNYYLTPQMKINYTPSTMGGTSSTVTIGSNLVNGRDCDSTYMQAYMLASIHYPTGGHTDFSFQTNQYYNNSNQLRLAGGLRITSIKSYDGINPNPVTKSYQYNSADSNFIFNYAFYGISTKHRWYSYNEGVGLPQLTASAMVRSYVSNPRVDLEPFDAAPVKYHNVTEYTGTPTNNTGMTNYLFNFVPDYPIDASLVGGDLAIENHFFERGELLTKTDFIRKQDGSYQTAKSVQNAYGTFNQQPYQYVGLLVRKINYNEGPLGGNPIYPESAIRDNDVNSYLTAYYWIQGGDDYLKSTTTSDYDLNDPTKVTTSTVQYKYDNFTHQQVSRTYEPQAQHDGWA